MPLVMFTLYNMLCIHYVPSYASTDPTSVGLGGGVGGGGRGNNLHAARVKAQKRLEKGPTNKTNKI